MARRHQHQSCSVCPGTSAGHRTANSSSRSRAPPGQDREELVPTRCPGGQARAEPQEPLVIRDPCPSDINSGLPAKRPAGLWGRLQGRAQCPAVRDLAWTAATDHGGPCRSSAPQIQILFVKREGKKSAKHFPTYLTTLLITLQAGLSIFSLQVRELRLREGK